MKPPSQRPKPKQPAEPKVTKVTGGAGTLKRKRQLRDALEELDKDYYDDIFESTPLKKFKKSVTVRYFVNVILCDSLKLYFP